MPTNQILTLLAAAALMLSGCGGANQTPPAQATAASATTPTIPVSINAVMVRVVDHGSHRLWDIEKPEMMPKNESDWETLEEHATQVAAAGALIQLEGTGVNDRDWVQQPEWRKWAHEVSNAGLAAFNAAQARNVQGVIEANGRLVDACLGCHARFKPTLPSEGIVHSHVH